MWFPRIVRSYLLHYGYEETLQLFDDASGSSVPPISLTQENGFDDHDKLFRLTERRILRQVQCPIHFVFMKRAVALFIFDYYIGCLPKLFPPLKMKVASLGFETLNYFAQVTLGLRYT